MNRTNVGVVAVAIVVSALLPARSATAADERAANKAVFARDGERLRRDFSGGPIVAIVGGEVLGGFDTLDAAVAAAEARRPGAAHRFLYRPGAEDGEESLQMSPWVDAGEKAGNWLQVGNAGLVARGLDFTIGEGIDVRYKGKAMQFPRAPYARFTIASPDGSKSRDAAFVMSTLMDRSMTITEALAADLGLDRFAVPGGARLDGTKDSPAPYRKVRLRLRLRDLAFDEEVIAVVVPGRNTESMMRGFIAAAVKIEVRPGLAGGGTAAPRMIEKPEEVKKIVDAAVASLVPSEPPAGWAWTNEVHFILADGRRVVTSIGPGIFGVRLLEEGRTKDYRLHPDLEAAIRPYLAPAPAEK